jgi:hypothetical protein
MKNIYINLVHGYRSYKKLKHNEEKTNNNNNNNVNKSGCK